VASVVAIASEMEGDRSIRRHEEEDEDATTVADRTWGAGGEADRDHRRVASDGYDGDLTRDHRGRLPPASSSSSPSSTLSSPIFASRPHLAILPVLLLEFLSLALTRAVVPSLLLRRYGSSTYVTMGCAECVRGVLAFAACPILGRMSDVHGRRPCLLLTVFGTLLPICSLAIWGIWDRWGWGDVGGNDHDYDYDRDGGSYNIGIVSQSSEMAMEDGDASSSLSGGMGGSAGHGVLRYDPLLLPDSSSSYRIPSMHRIDLFVVLLALSGVCSSTFTLTFAYISDVVKDRDGRVAAYGMALATFGLSFTIGPLLGGYLANVDDMGRGMGGRDHRSSAATSDTASAMAGGSKYDGGGGDDNSEIHALGQHRVFLTSLILALLDLLYIHFLLPESLDSSDGRREMDGSERDESRLVDASVNGGRYGPRGGNEYEYDEGDDGDAELPSMGVAAASGASNAPLPGAMGMGGGSSSCRASSRRWNPLDSVRYLASDPVLYTVGRVTFLYYTALHAVVSTLILYATRRFHLGPQRLGELMAALGLSTMLSEAVLVRIAIPLLGETRCMRIGLVSFSLQCVLLAIADSPWHLFGCAILAIAGNLVYPSVSSLVSSTVRPDMVGRALGAVNGVKSLTEGIGPLLFGTVRGAYSVPHEFFLVTFPSHTSLLLPALDHE
jgi:MFS family permease